MKPRNAARPRLLIISQVYVPDPASVGQHVADVAESMAVRGYDVLVLTSARGYDDPTVTYPLRERRAGVQIVRLPFSSFGKRSLVHRLIGQSLFLLQVLLHGVLARRISGILVSTSPPMASFAAVVISFIRRAPIIYWLMDFNPDQAIALNKVSTKHVLARALRRLNRTVFARAQRVIVLDRFMAERVKRQYAVAGQLQVLPPWPHNEPHDAIAMSENPFRKEFGLSDRFVVMYSGNHSPASPVSTLVQAAIELQDDPRFMFAFIGGGLGKRDVEEAIATTPTAPILSLPYQPLDQIKFSLSAADLHVVTLGNEMPGIIHPCKIYGAMAVGRPILVIGPRPSHASDLVDQLEIGWQVDQGAVADTVATLRHIAALPAAARAAMGDRASAAVRESYSKDHLRNVFCDLVEDSVFPGRRNGQEFSLVAAQLPLNEGPHSQSTATQRSPKTVLSR